MDSPADRIRSLTDQDSIFKAFDAYPWIKDTAFLSGLSAILGDNSPSPQPGSPRDMATHARIFYYAQRIGVSIDFATYQQWLTRHPEHQPPNVLPERYFSHSSHSSTATAWQQAAPKADLYVDRAANHSQSRAQSQAQAQTPNEPSYPMAFADMIKLIQEGKPVPGIRQIPNSIERDATVKPVGSRSVPKKPWEKDAQDTTPHLIGLEFPPAEEETSAVDET